MNDTSNPLGFSSFFFPNEQGTNLKLREKIALAQMMKKQAYPKTLGEGFASIGDSISDIITMRGLEKSDREAQAVATKLGAPQEAGAITPVSSAPTTATPVQAAAVAGGQDPTSQALVPPSVQEGGPTSPPGPMFRPNLRTSPVMTPAAPAVQAPPDVPGAIRMSTPEQLADFRAQNPLPVPPSPTVPRRPSVADYGQKLVLAPTPSDAPVVAKGPDPVSLPTAPPDDPRREIALAMLRQGQTGQPPAPAPAPAPAPQRVEVAPPDALQRVAQAQPQATPGYVPPELADPSKAVVIPPSKRERELQLLLNANQGNPYAATGSPAAMELQNLQTNRAKQQALEDKKTEANITRATKREEQRQQGLMDQDKRILESRRSGLEIGDLPGKLRQEGEKRQLEIDEARDKATLQARLGGRDPEKVFTAFDTEKESAKKATHALTQYGIARDLLDKGVITGTAQGWKVSAAKMAGAFGIQDAASAVARTEEAQAAIKSTLSIAIENIQGAGGKVSDTDVAIASGTIGADPALQLQTIRNLVTRGEKAARGKISEYEDQLDYYFGGTRAERRYQVPTAPTAPEPYVNKLLENKSDDAVRTEFDKRFGPGAAELEIARAKRRERRGG